GIAESPARAQDCRAEHPHCCGSGESPARDSVWEGDRADSAGIGATLTHPLTDNIRGDASCRAGGEGYRQRTQHLAESWRHLLAEAAQWCASCVELLEVQKVLVDLMAPGLGQLRKGLAHHASWWCEFIAEAQQRLGTAKAGKGDDA